MWITNQGFIWYYVVFSWLGSLGLGSQIDVIALLPSPLTDSSATKGLKRIIQDVWNENKSPSYGQLQAELTFREIQVLINAILL